MINFNFDKECYGCESCVNVCPSSAIKMIVNENGFLMPEIDKEKCSFCGKCETVCIRENDNVDVKVNTAIQAYAAYVDEKERLESTSGGVFWLMAQICIQKGGIVFGCIWNERFEAVHIGTNNIVDVKKMQKSKYVQSKIGNSFQESKKYLEDGKQVLFSGTPCQINALHLFLKKEYSNLICCCFICHGVPSPGVWKSYIIAKEKKFGKLRAVDFRDKINGWKKPFMSYKYETGTDRYAPTFIADWYMLGFGYNLFLRNSCYHCQAKKDYKADYILGDYWECTTDELRKSKNQGISIVVCNTHKSVDFWNEELQHQCSNWSVSLNDISRWNSLIKESAAYNKNRKLFFEKFRKSPENVIMQIRQYVPKRAIVRIVLDRLYLFDILKLVKKQIVDTVKSSR